MPIIGRVIRNGHGFEFIEMDQQTLDNCIDRLIDVNLDILKRVYARTGEFVFANAMTELTRIGVFAEVVLAMFEKCGLNSFTALNTELVKSISAKRNGEG